MIEAFRLGALGRAGTLWEGVNLSFGDGDVWLVAGPPSCGKTLLLSILRGDRRPEAGDVVVGGESLVRGPREAAASFRASVGLVPESFPPADPALRGRGARTIGDLFRLSAIVAGGIPAKERKRREEELLALVGLADRGADEESGTSSAGGAHAWALSSLSLSERARVALAAELLRNPKYLFADMLVANAGRDWTDTLGALFRALAREGRTIVLAERAVPDRWHAARAGDPAASGPFAFYRLGAVPPEPKRSALEWSPEEAGGEEGK
jgi:ABC-type multidrug transport system ATPase subunit